MGAAYDNVNYVREKELNVTTDTELSKAIIENNALSCIVSVLGSTLPADEKLKTIKMYTDMALERERKCGSR